MKSTLRMSMTSLALSLACLGSAAHAETPTLYVGMNGGDVERVFKEYVFPPFEQANNVKIVVVPGTSADILAKAQAFKDNPQMHLMFLDDGIMARAITMGLCEPIKNSQHINDLHPTARFKGDMSAAIDMGMTGIAYNKKMFDEKGWAAPTSWMDFADPKFNQKVVFQSAASSTFGLHGFLMFNRIQGGSEANVEPGFSTWQDKIGRNVLEYIPSSAKIAEMVQTGDAAIFPLTPTSVERLKAKGIPVEYAQPKEGSVMLMVGECVIAKNTQSEQAQKLADYLLSPEAQALAAQYGRHYPSNTKTVVPEEIKNEVATFSGYLKNAVVVDWEQINQARPEWNKRWNREVER